MNQLWYYRLGVPVIRALPRSFVHWVGLRVADRCFVRDTEGRAAVVANLQQVFQGSGMTPAEEAIEGLARKTYQYFGKNLVDFFRFVHFSRREMHRHVTLEHIAHLSDCFREGRGVIVVTAHFGNWELGGSVLAALGYPINAVVLPQRLAQINRLFLTQRKRHGVNVIELGRSPLALLRCLKRGELLALLADRDFTRTGELVTFFGKEALMPRGPAWLAHKSGSPIVPVFMHRLADDTFLLRCHQPIRPEKEGTTEAIQRRIGEVLEQEIAAQPHQWSIFQPFWS